MMRSLLRHYYKVSVGHSVAVDQVADALEREGVAHASAELLARRARFDRWQCR